MQQTIISTRAASLPPADGWIVLALAAATAAALTNVLLTLTAVTVSYVPIPFWDGWAEVSSEQLWSALFRPHNAHRIVVYRLVTIADQALTQGLYLVNLGASLALQALEAALFVALAGSIGLDRWERTLAVALAAGFLFWGIQYENFTWAFQTQFFAVTTFGTLSFFLLGAVPRWWGVAAALAAAVLAVGSMANGVLVPVLLVSLSIAQRRPPTHIATIAVAALILLALYFGVGYETADRGSPDRLLTDPIGLALYLSAYLGGPFAWLGASASGTSPGAAAAATGVAGLVALGGIGLRLVVCRKLATAARLALLHITLYVVGTGLVTAIGRIRLGVDQALSSRYATPALVFWLALLFLAWSLAGRANRRILPLAATVLLTLTLPSAATIDAAVRGRRDISNAIATAALAEIDDEVAIAATFAETFWVKQNVGVMRENRTGIFAWPAAQWLGTPLSAHVAIDGAELCRGAFDEAARLPADSGEGAFRVRGWAWQATGDAPPRMLVLTDGAGTIIGYALTDVARPDVSAAIPELRATLFSGWRGHVRIGTPGPVTAFALSSDSSRACPIGTKTIP